MQHHLTLPEAEYNSVTEYLAVKHNPLFSAGDTLTISLEGQRLQKSFTIVRVLAEAEKINKHYCILLLDAPGATYEVSKEAKEPLNIVIHDQVN